jgi:hypothetical protein
MHFAKIVIRTNERLQYRILSYIQLAELAVRAIKISNIITINFYGLRPDNGTTDLFDESANRIVYQCAVAKVYLYWCDYCIALQGKGKSGTHGLFGRHNYNRNLTN